MAARDYSLATERTLARPRGFVRLQCPGSSVADRGGERDVALGNVVRPVAADADEPGCLTNDAVDAPADAAEVVTALHRIDAELLASSQADPAIADLRPMPVTPRECQGAVGSCDERVWT